MNTHTLQSYLTTPVVLITEKAARLYTVTVTQSDLLIYPRYTTGLTLNIIQRVTLQFKFAKRKHYSLPDVPLGICYSDL